MAEAEPLYHTYRARGPRMIAALVTAFLFLAGLLWLGASPLIYGILALFTLPALWEVATNRVSHFHLNDIEIGWESGSRAAQIRLDDISEVRIALRWDFSKRMTVVTETGEARIPYECQPDATRLAAALRARDITVNETKFGLRA